MACKSLKLIEKAKKAISLTPKVTWNLGTAFAIITQIQLHFDRRL